MGRRSGRVASSAAASAATATTFFLRLSNTGRDDHSEQNKENLNDPSIQMGQVHFTAS
jgi:hypothetical protein